MTKPEHPIHGIRRFDDDHWEIWSLMLRGNVHCESAADAKRVAMALEKKFPFGAPVDYESANAAISSGWLERLTVVGKEDTHSESEF
jgi:hypothetical protein